MAVVFRRVLNRVMPVLPASAMRTHTIAAPLATHWRPATCEEVACPRFLRGWSWSTGGQPAEIVAVVKRSGRRYRIERDETTGIELLLFEAGQRCFQASAHCIRVQRPELFIARDGDFRGNPRGTDPVRFSGADAWADALHTHLDRFDT